MRRVFSFPAAVSSLLVAMAVATVRSRFDDPDMWWHLKLGEIMWNTHKVPTADLFSFTTNHHAYVPHEWLSQVLIYGAYRLAGYSGLMVWLCFFTSAILVAGYGLCSLYSGNAKVGFLGALAIWMFGTIGFAVRPQMIGYLLLIVELLLIQLGRNRSPRWFLGLPPLFAIWVNCHGSFFLGIVLASGIAFSSYFNFQYGALVAERWDGRRRRMLTWAVILSVPALLLNPVGARLVLYPLNLLLSQPINIGNVQEWQHLRWTDPRGLMLLGILGFILVGLFRRRVELRPEELLCLALGTWLAATHERMLFVFGVLAAPILARLLANSWDNYDAGRDRPMPNAVLIVGALLLVLWAFPTRRNLTAQVEQDSPAGAVAFIRGHHLAGPMLNAYVYGGYLIWAAPEYPDFIDGRTDIFEWTGVLQEYGEWATLRASPEGLLDKYRINFCLLDRRSPIAAVVASMPGWKVVYSDDQSVVAERVHAISSSP